MTDTQVANFVYWCMERTNRIPSGKQGINNIKHLLLEEFWEKYPNGILTGWSEDIPVVSKIKEERQYPLDSNNNDLPF